MLVIGAYSIRNGSVAMTELNRNHLLSVDCMKRDQLEKLFENNRTDLSALVETVRLLRQEAFQRLSVSQSINKARVEDYFNKISYDVEMLARSQDVLQAFVKFRTYKDLYDDEKGEILETIDTTTEDYKQIYEFVAPYFQKFIDDHGYDNFFIVDLEYQNVMFGLHRRPRSGCISKERPSG